MSWLALDIGGVSIKVADGRGFAARQPFALWEKPQQLAETLRATIAGAPPSDHLAATMTGELADCFATRTEGVRFLLDALRQAADGRHTRVYLTDGRLVSPEVARRHPLAAAASNWRALASFVGRLAPDGAALLMDIGSTTCDLVPMCDGRPNPSQTSDTERMICGELVYTGVQRSPLCSILPQLPYRGQQAPVAQELFATMWDVYMILGDLPEEPRAFETANRRPATRSAARDRLARNICADRDSFDAKDAMVAARAAAQAQAKLIADAAARVVGRMDGPLETIVISGIGEFAARTVIEQSLSPARVVSLADQLGSELSLCAPAHALAVLAREAAEG